MYIILLSIAAVVYLLQIQLSWTGIEPAAPGMTNQCSTTELPAVLPRDLTHHIHIPYYAFHLWDGARTRDLPVPNRTRYQLRYPQG
jgi:hypothetical protein